MFTVNRNSYFRNAEQEKIKFDDLIKRVIDYIENDPLQEYKLSIGTDSMTYKDTRFVLAIVLHRVGKGGIYFYKKFDHSEIRDLRTKLYAETQLSIETANLLVSTLLEDREDIIDKMNLSIHLDIGTSGPTKDLIKELEGWVTAVGYDYEIKPNSYAASFIADRYSK
ncbi:MAG: ribonuclease H-like YkuK family protein [Methanobrevibacter sp.]|nr:ribonuclease H-like YkuK family protein [Methanobrevibacter sp.]